MKKISVLLIFILVGVLAITSLGCDTFAFNGWFEDTDTHNKIRLGGNIQLLEKSVEDLPWMRKLYSANATGNIHLVDNTQKVTVQAISKLKGGDEENSNFFWENYTGYHGEKIILTVDECRVNGVKGYKSEWCRYWEEEGDDYLKITVWDDSDNPEYYWIFDMLSEELAFGGWLSEDNERIHIPPIHKWDDLE